MSDKTTDIPFIPYCTASDDGSGNSNASDASNYKDTVEPHHYTKVARREALSSFVRNLDSRYKTTASSPSDQSKNLTLEEIKELPEKDLVDFFTEESFDKKLNVYLLRCMLVPQYCNQTYSCYDWSRNVACKQMITHLMSHVDRMLLNVCTTSNFSLACEDKDKSERTVESYTTGKDAGSPMKQVRKVGRPKNVNKGLRLAVRSISLTKVSKVSNRVVKPKRFFDSEYSDYYQDGSKTFTRKRPKKKTTALKTAKFLPNSDNEDFSAPPTVVPNPQTVAKPKRPKPPRPPKKTDLVTSDDEEISHDHCYTTLKGKKMFIPDYYSDSDEDQPYDVEDEIEEVEKTCIIVSPAFPYVHEPLLPSICYIVEIYAEEDKPPPTPEGRKRPRKQKLVATVNRRAKELNPPKRNPPSPKPKKTPKRKKKKISPSPPKETIAPPKPALEVPVPVRPMQNRNNIKPEPEEGTAEYEEREMAKFWISEIKNRQHVTRNNKSERPFHCKICKDNKTFTALATLLNHYRSHAGIKPFVCSICGSSFTRRHGLKYHMSIHSNLKRFLCQECGKTFRHPSHYKEHLLKHQGEAPYWCRRCNIRFWSRIDRRKHMKTHNK